MRVAFVLSGLHRVARGAEAAFESIACHLARQDAFEVTLIGSGRPHGGKPYRFLHASCTPRERFERWPRLPMLRSECVYEELSFVPGLLCSYQPADYDVTVTCSYPFTNWVLRGCRRRGRRPAHVFVTQNGDWPAQARSSEYRVFSCDGLICTNPEYYQRNRGRWPTALIPNGVDNQAFSPGPVDHSMIGLRLGLPLVLMVSALIPSKRVLEGIRCVARLPNANLVVAGDGPLRADVDALGAALMPGRFQRMMLPRSLMPQLYRAASLLLHMSQDESFGNVYLEALAAGLPIVAHDRDVSRWILEDNAILVDTNDELAVAKGIDRGLRHGLPANVEACLALVRRRFTWTTVAERYGEFFRSVVAR